MARASKSARQRKRQAEGLFGPNNSKADFERSRQFHKNNGQTRKMQQFLEKHKRRLEGDSE